MHRLCISRFLVPLALLGLAAAGSAQVSRKVQFLSNFAPRGTTTNPLVRLYNDVWGYTAPDGREYALLGATVGVYIVDCTNPTKPVQRGFISGAASGWKVSSWRDMKTYGTYAYVVSEGGGGIQIVDLSNPDQPKLIKTWGDKLWPNAHSLAIDPDQGVAYVSGTRNGTFIVDVRRDPRNPTLVNSYSLPTIHDLHVQHGYGHLADAINNLYLIVDVTRLPTLAPVSAVKPPGKLWCHSAWATADDAYGLTTNEIPGGPLAIFDIRDKRNPKLAATFATGPPTAIIHNAFSRDRVAHVAYFTEGYRVVDLSDPANPLEVGFYDSWPGKSDGFAGVWGCYWLQPSGNVYVSDMQSGLHVVRPKATAVRYGAGTKGTGGRIPRIKLFGAAYLGNKKFRVEVEKAKRATAAILVLDLVPAAMSLKGLKINVWPFSRTAALLPFLTDAKGAASAAIPLPNVSTLNNLTLYAQFFVSDANGSLGFAATRGLAFTLFRR